LYRQICKNDLGKHIEYGTNDFVYTFLLEGKRVKQVKHAFKKENMSTKMESDNHLGGTASPIKQEKTNDA
jgi:hypothetical protein